MSHPPSDLVTRLWARDSSLWSEEDKVQSAISDRLGWLDSPQWLAGNHERLTRWAAEIRARGFSRAVLVGMGGSSLAAEVLVEVFASASDGLSLTVLDNTHPDAVRAALQHQSWARILFIFSSKSGTTAEVQALCAWVLENLEEQGVAEPGSQCIAITDPGSPLAHLALQCHFHDCLLNPSDLGGRFSALTTFAMAPAALAGIGLGPLETSATAMAQHCRGEEPKDNPGLALGFWLAKQYQGGRDCLELCIDDRLAPLAGWIEQLVAESTGKQGKGILPLASARQAAPPGRLARIAIGVTEDTFFWQGIDALANENVPLQCIELASNADLGGEFFRWTFAVAVTSALLGINPFDEPDVNASKQVTRDLLAGELPTEAATTPLLAGLVPCLRDAPADSYLAILAYAPPDPAVQDALDDFAQVVRDEYGLPVSISTGPRYLHSTGQLHKGGPVRGIFLFVRILPERDLSIFCEDFSLAELNQAQADGDRVVLMQQGRPVFSVDITGAGQAGARQLREKLFASLRS